ncbi:MAG: DUF4380 domain-containing protein [Ignavibacteriaceae bacterium]
MAYKRQRYIFSLFALILFAFSNYCEAGENSGLIILSNDKIEVGILPEIGGRIVLLRKPGFNNILKSDERFWNNPEKQKPEISAFSEFVAVGGHITWVGPQKEWWIHQNLNENRRKERANWPPDPYLIFGKNEIISKSHNSVKMMGPESPVSGVRLLKEISIDDEGIVTVKTTAENIRDEIVQWDLWMLTRLDGFAKAFVPIEENGILELLISETATTEPTPYKVEDKYFTFYPSVPVEPKKEQVQEAHLNASEGYIAGFSEEQMLLIKFEKLDKDLIHSSHGLVELYNSINETGDERLLELEVHGAYKILSPGETMSLTETWELAAYQDKNNAADQIKFLNNFLLKR